MDVLQPLEVDYFGPLKGKLEKVKPRINNEYGAKENM